jgi:hypothetical protein
MMHDTAKTLMRAITVVEQDILQEARQPITGQCKRVAACALFRNPLAGSAPDTPLDELVTLSVEIGEILTAKALASSEGQTPRAYGKAAIVGTEGDMEHGAAMIHVRAGLPIRRGAGGGPALIPGNCKTGAAGAQFDVILGGINDAWDYDAMDTMSLCLPDAPRPDEILMVVAFLFGTRPNARIEGASAEMVAKIVAEIEADS